MKAGGRLCLSQCCTVSCFSFDRRAIVSAAAARRSELKGVLLPASRLRSVLQGFQLRRQPKG